MSDSKENSEQNTAVPRGSYPGEMHVRQEAMADGRRYIIYYTFGEQAGREIEEAKQDV